MKSFVCKMVGLSLLGAILTLAAVAVTDTGAPGVYLFGVAFLAAEVVWWRLRGLPE
jgi:hypothetical protein